MHFEHNSIWRGKKKKELGYSAINNSLKSSFSMSTPPHARFTAVCLHYFWLSYLRLYEWQSVCFSPCLQTSNQFSANVSPPAISWFHSVLWRKCTRWFKYDRDKLWLVYTQSVPVIFEPPCIFASCATCQCLNCFALLSTLRLSLTECNSGIKSKDDVFQKWAKENVLTINTLF